RLSSAVTSQRNRTDVAECLCSHGRPRLLPQRLSQLSIPRIAKAAAAISLASVPLLAFAVPALAETAAHQQSPSAKPAMTGAVPRSRPVTPSVPGTMTVLMHQLGG